MARRRRVRGLIRLAKVGVTLAAISQEMQKPEAERTWEGVVLGFVPYDFRPPTWQRIRDAYWNPGDDRLLVPRPWGVGWAVNLFQARNTLMRAFDRLMGGGGRVLALRQRDRAS